MRAMFNRAAKQGLIHSNPFTDLRLPRCESKPKRLFSRAEIDAMVGQAGDNQWWATFINLAAMSGLRKDELLSLRWNDVDLDAGTVTVAPKRAESFTVGTREYQTWNWSAKAKASYRTVPIPADTVARLERLRVKQGASPFVFLSMDRLRQIQRHIEGGRLPAKFDLVPNLLRDFKALQGRTRDALAKATGKPVEWRMGCLHDLRRTYCTIMADHVPMHVLREWAGHADIATTCTFYLGVSEGMADKARAALTLAVAS